MAALLWCAWDAVSEPMVEYIDPNSNILKIYATNAAHSALRLRQLWDAVDADSIAGHVYYLALVLLGPSLATHLFLAQVYLPLPPSSSP
jgi:hypothetical protein